MGRRKPPVGLTLSPAQGGDCKTSHSPHRSGGDADARTLPAVVVNADGDVSKRPRSAAPTGAFAIRTTEAIGAAYGRNPHGSRTLRRDHADRGLLAHHRDT